MMTSRADLIRTLLKGIETGDPAAVAVVNEAQYIQHNPQTHEGSEGLASLFARLSKTNPRVNVVRMFEDGDFVFGMTEYDFATRRIGFEVFRFEGDQAVEHWDNIQPRRGPNPSGRSMVDGPVEPTDLDRTEENRGLGRAFAEEALIRRDFHRFGEFVSEGLAQHDPDLSDGAEAWRDALNGKRDGTPIRRYDRFHRVLACGDFVLCVCEGFLAGEHTSFYHLFRFEGGKIAEHWTTVEAVPPPETWKNDNGKF